MSKRLTIALATLLLAAARVTADWPQFLGPTRNGVYAGADLIDTLPPAPKILWKTDVGHGWSANVHERSRSTSRSVTDT